MALNEQQIKIDWIMISNEIDDFNQSEEATIDDAKEISGEQVAAWLKKHVETIRITIPIGTIQVTGTGNSGAPVISTNIAPIVIDGAVS